MICIKDHAKSKVTTIFDQMGVFCRKIHFTEIIVISIPQRITLCVHFPCVDFFFLEYAGELCSIALRTNIQNTIMFCLLKHHSLLPCKQPFYDAFSAPLLSLDNKRTNKLLCMLRFLSQHNYVCTSYSSMVLHFYPCVLTRIFLY